MVNALQGGVIDMAYYVPVQNVKSLESKFTILTSPSAFTYEVILNAKPGRPFTNIEARQAMQYLVPRQKFVENSLFGLGTPTCIHATKGSLGWSESLANAYQYDPGRAKRTFQNLGMLGKAPIEIVQLTGTLPGIGALAELTAAEMNAIGLNARLVPVDSATWADRFFGANAGDYDIMCSFMGRANRYPTLWVSTNGALKTVDNPSWGGGPAPADYSNAYSELLHAMTPEAQQEWATKLIQAGLNQSWDIAVANFGLQYALKKELTGVVESRDDYIQLEGTKFTQ
jgi:ABC-type transport system substrate-binding protein